MLKRNIQFIHQLSRKLYFTASDLANIFRIKPGSAKVLASRYAKNGIFFRLKRDFYVLNQNWQNYAAEDFFKLANLIQVPSYISFMTALDFYEMTTQVQRNFFESAAQKRTIKYDIKDTQFVYYKLKKEFYFDFIKQGDIFIATKEKALVDALYLYSFGKYKLDLASIDFAKFDQARVRKVIKRYPAKTKAIVSRLCKI